MSHSCLSQIFLQKKNEEAFIRAIDIAKHQLSLTCEVWLDSINRLLPSLSQAQGFDMKVTDSVLYTYFDNSQY